MIRTTNFKFDQNFSSSFKKNAVIRAKNRLYMYQEKVLKKQYYEVRTLTKGTILAFLSIVEAKCGLLVLRSAASVGNISPCLSYVSSPWESLVVMKYPDVLASTNRESPSTGFTSM